MNAYDLPHDADDTQATTSLPNPMTPSSSSSAPVEFPVSAVWDHAPLSVPANETPQQFAPPAPQVWTDVWSALPAALEASNGYDMTAVAQYAQASPVSPIFPTVTPWDLLQPATYGTTAHTSGDSSPSFNSYETPPNFPSSWSSGLASPMLGTMNTIPFPTIAEYDAFTDEDAMHDFSTSSHIAITPLQDHPHVTDIQDPISPFAPLSLTGATPVQHSLPIFHIPDPPTPLQTKPAVPVRSNRTSQGSISAAHAESPVHSVVQSRRSSLEQRPNHSARHSTRSSSLRPAQRNRTMPPRPLELRVMSRAEIVRLKPAERREIYLASLQSHAMRLVTVALSTPSFTRNAVRIEELAQIDHKSTRARVLELGHEVQTLLDRVKVLRATNEALRGRARNAKPLALTSSASAPAC